MPEQTQLEFSYYYLCQMNYKHTSQVSFFVMATIMFSCNNVEKNSVWSPLDGCKLERMEYQEISDTVHLSKEGGFESGVKASGKLIVNKKINIDTVGAYLKGGDKVFISQTTFRVIRVSQAFYEQYTKRREFLCQIVQGLKDKTITSEEGKKRAEKYYLDLIYMFSGLQENDERIKLEEEKNKNSGALIKEDYIKHLAEVDNRLAQMKRFLALVKTAKTDSVKSDLSNGVRAVLNGAKLWYQPAYPEFQEMPFITLLRWFQIKEFPNQLSAEAIQQVQDAPFSLEKNGIYNYNKTMSFIALMKRYYSQFENNAPVRVTNNHHGAPVIINNGILINADSSNVKNVRQNNNK